MCQPVEQSGLLTSAAPYLENVRVVANDELCVGMHLLRLHAPQIAQSILPGQFIHLMIDETVHTLRRPFSVFRRYDSEIEIAYQVIGAGTKLLTTRIPGDVLSALGPLGSSWPIPESVGRALVVGGGIGTAPLALLCEELDQRKIATTVIQGAQSGVRLLGSQLFQDIAAVWQCATDDGSQGHHGFVTGPVEDALAQSKFDVAYVCGPEPMQKAVYELCAASGLKTYVSFERLMACGVGACLSCVVPTEHGQKRACVDGPIFDAGEVLWDEARYSAIH